MERPERSREKTAAAKTNQGPSESNHGPAKLYAKLYANSIPAKNDVFTMRREFFGPDWCVRSAQPKATLRTSYYLPTSASASYVGTKAPAGLLSSVGRTRLDKVHHCSGGGLAQQASKHVTYDTEHGFGLLG